MEASTGNGRRVEPTPVIPAVAGRVGCHDRVAWLLRTNRLYGTNEKLATGSNFAKAFHGDGFRRSIDGAQVSRWERAAQRPGYPVLRRYEELLELPSYRLVAMADTLYREVDGRPGQSNLDRTVEGDAPDARVRTEQLIDSARSADTMSGNDWDELTYNLCAMPSVFLYPSSLWNDLVDRLLAEMIIADGVDWLQRSESVHRLLGHPVGEGAVIAACTALAADPANQVFVDPLTQLESSPHPDAASKILGQVANPTNEHALRGAWWSVAGKVGRGHFTPDDLATLARHAVELLTTDGQHPACRLAAIELLRQTDYPASRSMASAMRRIINADRLSRQVLDSGRVVSGETASAITSRVAISAAGMLSRHVLDDDPMLRHLLDDMLFHPQISVRNNTTFLVGATPYGLPVAHALGLELTNRAVLENTATAPAFINAISVLGDHTTNRFLQRLALAPGLPAAVAETILWTLGHGTGHCDNAFWLKAIGRYKHYLNGMRGIIYSLGLTRNATILRACRSDTFLPDDARRAAAWWLNIPDRIVRSTARPDHSPTMA